MQLDLYSSSRILFRVRVGVPVDIMSNTPVKPCGDCVTKPHCCRWYRAGLGRSCKPVVGRLARDVGCHLEELTELQSSYHPLDLWWLRDCTVIIVYNFVCLGSRSKSRNRLKYAMESGLTTVLLGVTSFPLIVCLTAASIFLPLIVVGISGTSMMNRGTCLMLDTND